MIIKKALHGDRTFLTSRKVLCSRFANVS